MHQDGWLIGYGMATALYDVPTLERRNDALVPPLWAPYPATGTGLTPRLGADPLRRESHPCRSL